MYEDSVRVPRRVKLDVHVLVRVVLVVGQDLARALVILDVDLGLVLVRVDMAGILETKTVE